MSDKRYLGNIITPTPTAPSGPYESDSASGVWSLAEAFTYAKAGLWPTAGNVLQRAIIPLGNSVTINYINIPSTGNALDFGDQVNRYYGAGVASTTRAVFGGGILGATGLPTNNISYLTIATLGNTQDFGDLTISIYELGSFGNATRGVFSGGYNNGAFNVVQYVTIASTGNATDFGDLATANSGNTGCASTTRGLVAGGGEPSTGVDRIQYFTISTTGNSTDFGNLTQGKRFMGALSSGTRAVFGGGQNASSVNQVEMDYVTIASTGNAADFGDLTLGLNNYHIGGTSNGVRGVFAGGWFQNIIQYITIASTGNSIDFGDLTEVAIANSNTPASNCHGGLQ